MNSADMRLLFDYNYWANDRLLDAADAAGPDNFLRAAEVSFGSVRGSLVHVFAAERVWRLRCQEGVLPSQLLSVEDFPTLADLRTAWQREEVAMRSYVASLSDADLAAPMQYANTKGQTFAQPLWQILMHVVNHGTQFRAETAVALSQWSFSPGDLDFIYFLRFFQK